MRHRNKPNNSKLAVYKPLLYCNSHLKQLYVGNKMERFSYKGGCSIRGHTHIEVFKSKAGLDYRQIALGYYIRSNIMLFKTVIPI